MRLSAILTLALLVAGLAPAAAAARTRPLCVRYRCATVAQDRLVRILLVRSRHPEEESESEAGHFERLDARTGRREAQPSELPNEQAPLPAPGEGCLNGALSPGPLVLAGSGSLAWTEYGHVCEMAHGSPVPLLLSAGPGVEPRSLLLADGFFIWREGAALRSAPAN